MIEHPADMSGRHRPFIFIVILLVVVAASAASGLAILWWKRGTAGPATAQTEWHTPVQTLLPSMRVRPVPGWRTRVADLGLPAPESGEPYKFADASDPFESSSYVGNVGDRAYFVVGNADTGLPQWWLAGVDVRNGVRLFAPVPLLSNPRHPQCYLNGPSIVLCLTQETANVTAWVIDVESGEVTYQGPTDLRTYPARLGVRQVGIYAVAQTQYQGLYGIGPHAETTWFVPGRGEVEQQYPDPHDFAPLTLATQVVGGTPDRLVTFSLKDGTVVKPAVEGNLQQRATAIYPGGFAAVIGGADAKDKVHFFDETGKQVTPETVPGSFNSDQMDLPVIALAGGGWAAYTAQGSKLLSAAEPDRFAVRVIGDVLFVRGAEGWQQYNMRSGVTGKTCTYPLMEGYLGTDGAVAVTEKGNAHIGVETTAYDLASCDKLWSIKSPAASFRHAWRINTTLVQLSDDGTELMSLVAPG